MAYCDKFFERIKHINFNTQPAKALHQTLLKSAHSALMAEHELLKGRIDELLGAIQHATLQGPMEGYINKQREALEAIGAQIKNIEASAHQQQIDLAAESPFNDELIAEFANNFRNIHHLADTLTDAPPLIKTCQTQLFIQILFKLNKKVQEQQLETLTPDNIDDMVLQAVATYNNHPDDKQLRAKCQRIVYLGLFELIRRDCQKLKPTADKNYDQYLAFIRELKRKIPEVGESSIMDKFCHYRDSNEQTVGNLLLSAEKKLHIVDDQDWTSIAKMNAVQQRHSLYHQLRFGQADRREYVKKRQDKTIRDYFFARNIRDKELFTKSGQSNALFADLAEKRYFRKPSHPFQLVGGLHYDLVTLQKLEMALQNVIKDRRDRDFPIGDVNHPLDLDAQKKATNKIKEKFLYESMHPVIDTDINGNIISVKFVYIDEERAKDSLSAILRARGFNNNSETLVNAINKENVLKDSDINSLTIYGNTLANIEYQLTQKQLPKNQKDRYKAALEEVKKLIQGSEYTDISALGYNVNDEILLRKLLELYDLHTNHQFPRVVTGPLRAAFQEIYKGNYLGVIRIKGIADTVKAEYDEKLAKMRADDIPPAIQEIVEPIIQKAEILRLSSTERHTKLEALKAAFTPDNLPHQQRVDLITRLYLDEFQSMRDTLSLNDRDMDRLERDILLMAEDITTLIERTNQGKPVLKKKERQAYFDIIRTIADRIKPWNMADVAFKVGHSTKIPRVTINHKNDQSQTFTLNLGDITLPYSLIKPPESNEFIFSFGGTRGIVAPFEGLDTAYAGDDKDKQRFFTYCRLVGVGQYGTVKEMESLLTGLNQVLKKGNVPTADKRPVFEEEAKLDLRTRPITSIEDPLYLVEIYLLKALSKAEQAVHPSAANGVSYWLDNDKMRKSAGKLFRKDGAPRQYHTLAERAPGDSFADTSENRVKEYTKTDKIYHNPCLKTNPITLLPTLDREALVPSLKDMLALSSALCSEVGRFHELGFIHNDIKPENFLYQRNADGSYNVKFIDWATGGFSAICDDNGTRLRLIFEELFGKELRPKLKDEVLSDEATGCFVFKQGNHIHYGINPTLQILHGARNCTLPYITPHVLDPARYKQGEKNTILDAHEKLMDNWALTAMTFGICNRHAYFTLVKGRTVPDYVVPGILETDGKTPLGLEITNTLDFNQLFACTPSDSILSPHDVDTDLNAVMYIPTTEREGEPLHLFRRLQTLRQLCAESKPMTAEKLELINAIDHILITVRNAVSNRNGLTVDELQQMLDLSQNCVQKYEKIFDEAAAALNKNAALLKGLFDKYLSELQHIRADYLLHLVDVDAHISELDILCTYPNSKASEDNTIAILNQVFTPAEFEDKFLIPNAPGGHLFKDCIASGQQRILTHLLAKIPRNSALFADLVRKQGLLHYALQEGLNDIARDIIHALGASPSVFEILMQEYDNPPIRWSTNALHIAIRNNDKAQLTAILDLLPEGDSYDNKIYEAMHLCAVFSNPTLFQLIEEQYNTRNPKATITAKTILSMRFAPDYSSPYHLFLQDEKTNSALNPEADTDSALRLNALKDAGLVRQFLLEAPSPCLIAAEKSNVAALELLLDLAQKSHFSSEDWYELFTKTDSCGKNILNHLLEHRLFDYLSCFFDKIARFAPSSNDAIVSALLDNVHPVNPLENFLSSPLDRATHYKVLKQILDKVSPPGLHATEAQQRARVVALLVNNKWLNAQAHDPAHLEELQSLLCNDTLTIPFKVMLFSELKKGTDNQSQAYALYHRLLNQVSPVPEQVLTPSMKIQLGIILEKVAAQKEDMAELLRLHTQEMDALTNKLQDTEAHLKLATEESARLREEAEQHLTDHKLNVEALELMIEQITSKSAADIQSLRTSLTQQLDLVQQQKRELEVSLEQHAGKTDDECSHLLQALKDRQSQLASKELQIRDLETTLSDVRSKHALLLTGVSQISEAFGEEKLRLLEQLATQIDKIKSITVEVQHLRETLNQVQIENHSLQESIDSLKLINSELGQQLTKQQRELKRFRLRELTQFDIHLKLIVDKANKMETEKKDNPYYKDAISVATKLRDDLVKARQLYLEDGHRQVFKQSCIGSITLAHGVLKNHRGWKQTLADIAYIITSVLTLGVGYALGKRYGWFQTETDSSHKLAIFKGTVEQLEEQDAEECEANHEVFG